MNSWLSSPSEESKPNWLIDRCLICREGRSPGAARSSRGSSTALGMTREETKMLARLLGADKSTLAPMIRTDVVVAAVTGALFTSGAAHAQPNIEQIVTQKVQPILPKTGTGGGVAVAVRMNGNTSFFNYGMADNAQKRQVTADSIFNLGSVGKVFATTLLAQAVKQGELSLDDPVAKYVTELQRGSDIRRITLGQLATIVPACRTGRRNTRRGTKVDIHAQILFASSIPGKRVRTMNLANNTSIPIRPWCCSGWPSNVGSTRGSRP